MESRLSKSLALVVGAALSLAAGGAAAGIHTWDVKEVFSGPAAGANTVQFVELFDAGAGGTEINVGNGTLTSSLHPSGFAFGQGTVTGPTNGKRYLIATQSFADLPGAPTPDVIIPSGLIPFFDASGDTVTFSSGDSLTFGAVPTNGIDSFDEDAGTQANSPQNYAGTSGSVDASGGGSGAPLWSAPFMVVAVALLALLGIATTWRRARIRA